MLTDREKFKDIILAIAQKLRFRPVTVEKDYYLTVIINNIETLLSDKIVFKGGTLLNKAYLNCHRLSEDLDFAYCAPLTTRSQRSKAIVPIREKMPDFLKALKLTSDKPDGEGFNNSKQYVFKVKYPSVLMAKDDIVRIEISLRQPPLDKPVYTEIKHFYQDPFTGENLFPLAKVLSLSWNEAVAEKLKATISRKDMAVRDYYDLWCIKETKFDFHNKRFIEIFKEKLSVEGYKGKFSHNFGLTQGQIDILHRQIESDLMPVIRADEQFDIDKVFKEFDEILDSI